MTDASAPPQALRVEGLTRRFGGLVAVNQISFSLAAGRLNAIIGPNGAGKTTLFNLISGELRADAGRIEAMGADITGLSPHRIAQKGISRTLQIKSVFSGLTVADNLRVAVMAHEHVSSPFRQAASYTDVARRIEELMADVGLSCQADTKASALSYGDIALLEIALALANRPRLLLLDEPVCGMGPHETEQTVAKIRDIGQRVTVVLIEHDMEVVFSIADEILVMAQGALLARGTPKEISANRDVQEAYLGIPEEAA